MGLLRPFPGGGPAEWGLLLLAARAEPHPDVGPFVEEAGKGGLDWPEVIRLASAQGVTGLVSNALAHLPPDLLPPDDKNRLKDAHRAQGRANLGMVSHLGRILDAFAAESLSVVPWKGPVLATRAYGDVSLRVFGDLDLLVKEGELEAAKGVLKGAGLISTPASQRIPQELYRRWGNALPFLTRDLKDVELHWRLSDPYWGMGIPVQELWDRTALFDWMGRPVLGFSTEDQILTLCAHGARHAWDRLIWVCDVAETLRREPVDWDVLMDRAAGTGTLRMVQLGTALAHQLLDAPVPDGVKAALTEDRAVQALVAHCRRVLMGRRVGSLREFGFHVRSRDTTLDRVKFLTRAVFTPSDSDLQGVGRRLPGVVLQLRRPLRLARKYFGRTRGPRGWRDLSR